MRKTYEKIEDLKGNLATVYADQVSLGELARIDLKDSTSVYATVLRIEGKKVTLQIGQPFQIEGKPGDPEPPEDSPHPDGTDGTNSTNAAPPSAAPAAPAGTDAKSEIMRKMMERRAKEMNK